jgi:hypothetical protein
LPIADLTGAWVPDEKIGNWKLELEMTAIAERL